jgi:AcrR family transcriptional regulator
VFAKHGFARTTVDLIAAETGVAKGTLYLYYPSKVAIYSAAVIAGLRELAAATTESLAADVPIRDKLRRLLEMRVRYFEERADFFRIYNAEIGNLGQGAVQIRQEYRRLYEQQVDRLAAELRRATRAGAIRAIDAQHVAFAVLDLAHGLVQRRLDSASAATVEDVDVVLTMIWKGIEKQ